MTKARRTSKRRKHVSLAPIPKRGDHGANTPAATQGTVLEAMVDDKGRNPNNIYRRRRRPQSAYWENRLSMRQLQAAQSIETAYAAVQELGSGGDSVGRMVDLQTQVQASPKPDASIDVQAGRQSRLIYVMSAVPQAMRPVIEHLFWHGLPLSDFGKGKAHYERSAEVKVSLDLVANKLCY